MREIRICPDTGTTVLLNDQWPIRPAPAPPPPPARPACALRAHGPIIAQRGPAAALPHPTPILGIEGDPTPQKVSGAVRIEGVGAHELIVGSHTELQPANDLELLRDRQRDLRRDTRLRGFSAGLRWLPGHHTCWQLLALPIEPIPAAPTRRPDLLLEATPHALIQLAWAPKSPAEAWILPTTNSAKWEDERPEAVAAAAHLLHAWLPRISAATGGAAGCPIDAVLLDGAPWRIELRPAALDRWLPEAALGWPVHGCFPEAAKALLLDR